MNRASTPAELAAVDYDPFADASLSRVAPTTESQREIWLASGLGTEASLAYNESVSFVLRGALALDALRTAVRQLIARHEALRATISADGQELCIVDALEIDIPLIDASGSHGAVLRHVLDRAVNTPFDLQRGPLIRAEIVAVSGNHHVLVLTAHHIVCDGWSFAVLARDLGRLYAQYADADADAVSSASSFADYAVAENERTATAEHTADERYWLGVFNPTIPTLELPVDRPRKTRRTFASRREDRVLAPELIARARRLGSLEGASLFSTLLGGFAATLSRLTGANDLVIGVPWAGQSIGDQGGLVGHCVNLLPIRLVSASAEPLPKLIAATQRTMFDAFEHAQCTFGSLLKKLAIARDPSRLPLVSVMFNLDQQLEAAQLPFAGLEVEFAGNPRSFENFELFVNAVQVGGGLRLECQYNTDLFDAGTIQRWLACYETLLRAACETPETTVGELRFVSDADCQLLATWNDTRIDFRRESLVHTRFEEQARREPMRPAVCCGDLTRSYGQLDAHANRIAHALRGMGVRQGALVGLHIERNADLLAAILGVLKAGGAYVPLDPAYPADRLSYMATDAGLTALVSQASLAPTLGWPRDRSLLLDQDAAVLQALPGTAPPADTHAEQPAYVIYTSGSTGKPKGVRVPHRAVVNFLDSMQREPGLTADDRLVAVTTLSFDIAVTELLLPLAVGAQVVLASREEAIDGVLLASLIERSEATVMQATPATWRLLLEGGWPGGASFKALCGGEALTTDLAQALIARTGSLWNMYGPTETTVWSSCCRIGAADSESISIGRPLANTVVRVLDERLQLCPIGIPGEIFIGGDGLTSGYHHRPELTAERFVADPFALAPEARLYRTGDRGRWRVDGLLEHLGRNDFQVKVRGYRIEPGEIEACLQTHPQVARAVAVALEVQPGDVRLVAYVVAREAERVSDTALHAHLKLTLPDYMVPQHVVWLPVIPLLPNGKVDRRALPPVQAVNDRAGSGTAFVAPASDLERQVVSAMETVLTLGGLGMHDDFFRLGGHSLLAAKLIARLNSGLNVRLPMRTAFECTTASQLVDAVQRATGETQVKAPAPVVRHADQTRGPLTMSQQRMRFIEELHPGRVAYNTPSAHRLKGPMQLEAFDRAFAEVVSRQPALRTAIVASDADHEQRVLGSLEFSLLPIEDLSSMPEREREPALMRQMDELIAKPFDLTRPPLFVAKLFKLSDNEHVFFFMAHHIVWDGWSFDLLYEEIAAAYQACVDAKANPRPAPAVSCIDHAHWQNLWLESDDCRSQVAHWQTHFAGARAACEIRSDFPRKPGMSGRGSTEWVRVPRELTERLRGIAQEAGATLNMASLAAYAAMLHATAPNGELTLGIPVRGRTAPELEPVMGFFNNLLPLRMRVEPGRSFVDWVRDVKQLMLDAMGHQDVPFEKLAQEVDALRSAGSAGYYQALFSFQDARERTRQWAGLEQQGILVFQPGATEDLGLWLMEVPTGLEGGVTYNADIFRKETAQLLRDRYLRLLERIARHPTRSLTDLLDIGDEETRVLEAGLAEAASHDIVARPVDGSQNLPALQWHEQRWSRGELWGRADAIGAALRLLAPQAKRVAVRTVNPLLEAAAWLAIWQAGMTCVVAASVDPLDAHEVDAWIGDEPGLDPRRPFIDIVAAGPSPVLAALQAAPVALEIVAAARVTPVNRATLGALAQAIADRLELAAGDCFLVAHGMPDATRCVEVLATLACDGVVVFVSNDTAADGDQMAALITQTKARAAHLPPSAFRALLDAWWTSTARFAAVVDGVEASAALATALVGAGCEAWSLHRPAFSGVPVALDRVTADAAPMHMGRPLLRGLLSVRASTERVLPVGSVGRLHVALSGSQAQDSTERACIGSDGRLVVFASADTAAGDSICLDGHRVVLSALEDHLKAEGVVAECIAVVDEERPGDRRLHFYVVPGAGASFDESRAQMLTRTMLPPAVRAGTFTSLAAVARLADGRPDRAALAARVAGGATESARPSTPTELALVAVWSELLGVSQIELGDNFFDLGGSSLLAMQASERLAASIGKRIAPRRYVFETLGQLALAYDASDGRVGEPVAADQPTSGGLIGRLRGLMRRSGA